jgi:hypothetical protein
MTSSNAEVIPAEASDATCAEAADATSAEAADVTATKATDVTAAKAAHVAAAEAAAVPAATATAGLRTGSNKAAGKQRTCQNHYQSSSHDISPLGWADVPPQNLRQVPRVFQQDKRRRRDGLEMGILARHLY